MDFAAVYHFLFETFAGVGCLVAAVLVISLIVAILGERKTRKTFRDRGNAQSEWDSEEDDN